jgi:hypothetical protein
MTHLDVLKFLRSHKFQNVSMHIYLRFASCNLMAEDGPEGPKHVQFIDDIIKSLLCLTVMYMPILICHSIMGWIPLSLFWFISVYRLMLHFQTQKCTLRSALLQHILAYILQIIPFTGLCRGRRISINILVHENQGQCGKEIPPPSPHPMKKPRLHYRVQNKPSLDHNLSQRNPSASSHDIYLRFILVSFLPSMPRIPTCSHPFDFSN